MKRILSMLLAAAALCMTLTACTLTGPEATPSDAGVPSATFPEPQVSAPIDGGDLESAYQYVLSQWAVAAYNNFSSLPDPVVYTADGNKGKNLVYAYKDIDQNGTPELIIAFSDGSGIGQQRILDIFAFDGQKAVRLFAGIEDGGFWSRNACQLANENKLAVFKSGGAESYSFTLYEINPDGCTLKSVDRFGVENGAYFHGAAAADEDEVTADLITYWVSGLSLDLLAELDWKPVTRDGPLTTPSPEDAAVIASLSGYWEEIYEGSFAGGFYFGPNATGYVYSYGTDALQMLDYGVSADLSGKDKGYILEVHWLTPEGGTMDWRYRITSLTADRLILENDDSNGVMTHTHERVQNIRSITGTGAYEVTDMKGQSRQYPETLG